MTKMNITLDFTNAISDYKYFIEKEYPEKAVLKIIGDRYKLSGIERTLLFRGISKKSISKKRKGKLLTPDDLDSEDIFIDGYNVLITIGSYLNGNVTFIGTDGLLRDAAESHGKINKPELLDKALKNILDYFSLLNIKSLHFYFDAPVSNSRIFSDYVNEHIAHYNLKGESINVDSPDYLLKNITKGIICTSDSAVIDNAKVKLFDIARHSLEYYFNPDFIFL
jgi:hypothetical protein